MAQALRAKTRVVLSLQISFIRISISEILINLILCDLCGSAVKSILDKSDIFIMRQRHVCHEQN